MIRIKKEECTGCSSCYSGCPHDAISMREDSEGFLYPTVIEKECQRCGTCENLCPILNFSFRNTYHPSCYGAWVQDSHERHSSSSGGIFPILARSVLGDGGYVCGARFNKAFKVEHVIIADTSQLNPLKGSKYVQSDLTDCFKKIRKLLDRNEIVLFSGTPCQVAGLYSFLGKEYERLVTIDLLCHGTPSHQIFNAYLKEAFENTSDIKAISFRDKVNGWYNMTVSVKFLDSAKHDLYESAFSENLFMHGFHKNLYLRPSCYTCRFVSRNRFGDITLGDFWNIEDFDKELLDNKGISLVLLNNDRGTHLYNQIGENLAVNKRFTSEVLDNRFSVEKPSEPHKNRDLFFEKFNGTNFEFAAKRALGRDRAGIVNFHYNNNNYGAILSCYAILTLFRQLDWPAELIDFRKNWHAGRPLEKPFKDFTDQYLSLSPPCYSEEDLMGLNEHYEKIVVGSDQLWRWHLDFTRFLNWVVGNKVLFSFATSFGDIGVLEKKSERGEIKRLLSRFDKISVRESSGVKLCERFFNLSATQISDPTLLIDISHYERIIENENISKPDFDYVGFMSFYDDTMMNDQIILKDIRKKYPLLNLQRDETGKMRSVAEWLNYVKHAKYIITSSFHGTIFSILYKKQFVTFDTKQGGTNRIANLLDIMKIDRRLMHEGLEQISLKSFEEPILYKDIDAIISQERETAFAYLNECLSLKATYKHRYTPDRSYLNRMRSLLRDLFFSPPRPITK